MKKIIIMATATLLMLALATSCKKDNNVDPTGDWKLVSMGGVAAETVGDGVDVYVSFEGGNFTTYERVPSTDKYKRYSGTYSVSGKYVEGVYSDGTLWAERYELVVKSKKLTMKTSSGINEYAAASIPQAVIDNSYEGVDFKSFGDDVTRCL